jgi:hypothetical protein
VGRFQKRSGALPVLVYVDFLRQELKQPWQARNAKKWRPPFHREMPIGDICQAAGTLERLFVKLKSFPEMGNFWEIFQSGGG